MTPIATMRDISKTYTDVPVLDRFNLDIAPAEKVVLIGPSGSGKTTVLRTLMTVEMPDWGDLAVDGVTLHFGDRLGKAPKTSNAVLRAYRSKLGMVFQQFNLFPHMTIEQNLVEAPIHVAGMRRGEAVDLAHRLLAQVGLSDKVKAFPNQLSGGQQQRVAIARALAMNPKVLLFDEVTSALDPERVGEVLEVIRDLSAERSVAMLIVTHEMGFARQIADRTIFMEAGRIVEEGPPEQIFGEAQNPRTRAFLGKMLHP
ncbi:amino acid ABC transporter ATP-binding protein [Acuticoccus mangrovi]|uniref:Amino acid ABC transporter ATP-binding protein n=1 Tax=Acuticoccus mangrovi TaxID=2796142 RepID=A0A934IF07_9HYPH|nr:amino acid ABC transporter ATP-binding protein [Acuticoccus mangrovi]MBJ3775323.1 amino acid ABC transporter ATP-binding protein [Acuticoccus mangrovi]